MYRVDEIHKVLKQVMKSDQIDHWQSDLYCKVTPKSEKILEEYEWKRNVETFRDQVTGALWYDIPFAYNEKEDCK